MAAPAPPLVFNTAFVAETGRPVAVAPGVVRVTAPNAGAYTFTGTNSFLLGEESVAIVDPGPDDDSHLRALLSAIGGRKVEAILLTHTHKDHSSLAPKLKAATGAPIWFEGRHRLSRAPRLLELNGVARSSDWALVPDRVLKDGETIEVAGMRIEVIATPGHCANHLAFGLAGTPWLLSGDHVMGWNSTLVSVPDGSMADYLASLHKVIALPYAKYLPAHGGAIEDGRAYAEALLAHRQMRNEQIVDGVRKGARTIGQLLRAIYPQLALPLIPAARMVLKAHVEYLEASGEIAVKRGLFGVRLTLPR
jgi:glyoxylase-like metal-dependent hydrolase (beta-lactamase superfamily II)